MSIADSTHKLSHWGAPGVAIHADNGLIGYGFSGTHAHLPTDRLIVDCIVNSYGPLLIGEDPREVRALWEKFYRQAEIYWVGRAGITHLALGTIDIALWNLKSKEAELPLWSSCSAAPPGRKWRRTTPTGAGLTGRWKWLSPTASAWWKNTATAP